MNAQQSSNPTLNGDGFDAQEEHRHVIILGAGPAGLTAALYAARANLEPLVLQGIQPGGQLITTTDVENYPGFADGILGPDLMTRFEDQAKRFGAELRLATVTNVNFNQRPFRLLVDDKAVVLGDAVIISTGASAKYLGLSNEQRLIGRGVSACATCDGALFNQQDVAVVGGGDTAMEETLFLTRFATHVYVIHRRDALRASQIMQERALAHPKITFMWNTVVEEVAGKKTVEALELRNIQTNETSILTVQGLFVAIGHQPNTALFQDWLDMDEVGYIRTQPGSTHTSIEGVFAAGDVQDHVYRQAVTASGTGAMAAIDAERWLAQQVKTEIKPPMCRVAP